ncbi:SRPBCC family protein [Isoptericola sp. b441]|uniref:SRPBCC family protein n=1 Tax=Actinotalea lenta TaxID=3064654 RepID=A0ABT9D952_9CELL|nr:MULTISPECIES: SRPBCC family protein [unclassified Isoptericola]MDO8107095.1 SRPBCC family protein [Isoptericola sp. b441]MDO8121188.1 SRPBCC family protein [Isoptericola sp. b490]
MRGPRAELSFADSWTLPAPPDRIRDVVVDLEHWMTWWPQVLAVASLGPDDARVIARSVLPHTLDLVLHATCRDLPVLAVELDGDLEGVARWELAEDPAGTLLRYEQHVVATGALAVACRVLRPLMRWNHDRMMAGAVAGLRALLTGEQRG